MRSASRSARPRSVRNATASRAASSMCARRARSASGSELDIGLGLDALAEQRAELLRRAQVDLAADQFGQPQLETGELDEADDRCRLELCLLYTSPSPRD